MIKFFSKTVVKGLFPSGCLLPGETEGRKGRNLFGLLLLVPSSPLSFQRASSSSVSPRPSLQTVNNSSPVSGTRREVKKRSWNETTVLIDGFVHGSVFFRRKKINMKSILPNVFDFVRYSFFVPSNSPRQPKLKSSFPSPPLSPLFLYFRSSRHSKEEKVPIVFLWPHFFELSILRTNFAFFFGGSRFAKNNGQRTQACANGTF